MKYPDSLRFWQALTIGGLAKIRYAVIFWRPERVLTDGSDNIDDEAASKDAGQPSRVRFKSIVESERFGNEYGVFAPEYDTKRWSAMGRQAWLMGKLAAIFVVFAFIVGPPLGNYIAHMQIYGTAANWNPLAAFDTMTVLLAVILPVFALIVGYAISRMATMMNAAESIAAAASQYVTPDITAAHNADAVGEVVRGHIVTLNEGLDGALTRLASVEAMIRQHVEAIEIAGEAIEQKATGAVNRVADERSRLMELTETLNSRADAFAAAIATRAQRSVETMQAADTVSERVERDFEDRLGLLEDAAGRAVASFESLRSALRESSTNFTESASTIDEAARQTESATKRANAAADAAADSAARNAANVAASAQRAFDMSRKAADEAIEAAMKDAERIADSAITAAGEQANRVKDAATEAVTEMSAKTSEAVEAASADAEKAAKAAADVSDAARQAADAAQKASQDVAAASETARQHSEEALKYSEGAAGKIAERNKALADARAALEKENQRLENLIEEQRQRADRLAEAISSQTERLTKLAEAQLREQENADRIAEAQRDADARAAEEAEQHRKEKAQAEADARAAQEAERKAKAEKEREAQQRAQTKPAPPPTDTPSNGAGAARLEELARDIAERRPRKKKRAAGRSTPERVGAKAAEEPRSRRNIPWREILDAADDAEPLELDQPVKKKPAPPQRDAAAAAMKTIADLQAFTYDLETRLYGDPPPALQERYERGDRNVFANRLLRLNEADVKRRIRNESARDRAFERNVQEFLQRFEKLLEDATTSETADEELEEYLSSPLGRVYLLIGATVGYFA